MSIWDQPGVAPAPRDFIQFEIPGTAVSGRVVNVGVKTWPPKDGQPQKTDPEFVILKDDGTGEVTLTVGQWKLRQALFDERLDMGDWVGIRYTGKTGNTKNFDIKVIKAANLPAVAPAAPAPAPAPAPAAQLVQTPSGPQIQAQPAAQSPWTNAPAAAPAAQPELAPTGTGGAPW